GGNLLIAQSHYAMARWKMRRKACDGPQQVEHWWFRDCPGRYGCRIPGNYAEQEFGASSGDTLRKWWDDCCIRFPRKSRGRLGNDTGGSRSRWHLEGRLCQRGPVCKKRDLAWRDRLR